ncbi:hypothetical protein P0D88_40945 [Paraburkholderia sp. RL18-103-BIB-C]|uniref:hypothetical protein n=1 Tax=unclassified Paraburkholderia TaxID=2615204 RepID=UPI0038B8DD65
MKKMQVVGLSLACSSVVFAAEASAPQSKLLSVSTFTANGASVELSAVQRPDGQICREYVRDVSVGADGKTTITTGTHCDGDKLSQG